MKTIDQVKQEMQGYGNWSIDQWYNYLKELTEEVRQEVFKMMNAGEIRYYK